MINPMRLAFLLPLLVAACVPLESAGNDRRERCPHVYGLFLDDKGCVPPRRGGDGGGRRIVVPEDPGTGGGGT